MSKHGARVDPSVEVLGGYMAGRQGRLFQAEAGRMRVLRNGSSFVIADMRGERGDQHERLLQVTGYPRTIRLDAFDTTLGEAVGCVAQ